MPAPSTMVRKATSSPSASRYGRREAIATAARRAADLYSGFGRVDRLRIAALALLAILALAAPLGASVDQGSEPPSDLRVPVHAALSQETVTPGGTVHLAVVYEVPPDAHIQKNEFFCATPVEGEPFVLSPPALPAAVTFEGEMLVSVNVVELVMVKVSDAGWGDPVTLTAAVPAVASSVAGTRAESCVADTNVVD